MALNLLYLHARDEESAITFLQQHNVLRQVPPNCITCNRVMSLVKSGRGEERIFRCPLTKFTILFLKKDSFWESSHLKFKQIVELLFLWAFKIPISTANDLVDVSEKTIVQWFAYFRDICTNHLVNNPYRIKEPGVIVEIDKSLVAKRKNNVGHVVERRWVFGGVGGSALQQDKAS
ncbi:hypothetical protein PoB_001098000 [Plakobranchus ocellatus]|uniref:Transposase n=1 Tax=Plakobranchus ocellatus TaxID=259542 RepID=A0AAV3YPW2_9GAST|nr:hypothetical protein PoB_001098000 [Plakobranchus ocellatus]